MKRSLIPAALFACVVATACSQEASAPSDPVSALVPEETVQERAEGPQVVSASAVTVRPGMTDIVAVEGAALPELPPGAGAEGWCEWGIEPETAGGQKVTEAGWTLLEELPLGKFKIVSFAGSLEPATSGACYINHSYVGVYDGETLVSLLEAAGGPVNTGRISTFEDKGRIVRIWDGDIAPLPLADLVLTEAGTLEVAELTAEEKLCDGASIVPNIYGKPLSEARASLATYGWQPHAQEDAEADIGGRIRALKEQGVIEVTSCSGTGFGYCAFEYRRPESALTVTTIGDAEDPAVSSYELRCAN